MAARLNLDPGVLDRLYRRATDPLPFLATSVTRNRLADAVTRSTEHRFGSLEPDARAAAAYVASLHAADLALACACADGDPAAWEHVMTHIRPSLYGAARAMTRDETAARDLTDSMWADLYGLKGGEPSAGERSTRRSLFVSFQGRSKLSTWLRAVLAQRHVDAIREADRTVPLPDDHGAGISSSRPIGASSGDDPDPHRSRYLAVFEQALTTSLQSLAAGARLRLAYYYVQGLTLAEIGRLVDESEATVSRKLAKARREVRADVERILSREHRLTEAEIGLCYEYALGEWPFDLTQIVSEGLP